MELSALLSAQLAALTEVLADPDTDLEGQLRALIGALMSASPSFLGLSLTTVVDDDPVTLRLMVSGKREIAASLLLPLPSGGGITLYVADPDAGPDGDGAPVLAMRADLSGLAEMSVINQALGLLIGGGRTVAEARAELHRQAEAAGDSVLATAERLLRER